jgi:zinc and cadmium transporter
MNYSILILAVAFGYGLVFLFKPKTNQVQFFLSFSGAYLLSITVLSLLPEVFETKHNNIGLFILLGVVFQTILEYLSKGAEHGHIHSHDFDRSIPWLLLISLSMHAFLEGMPLGLEEHQDLLWAVVIHKIPIAIILAVFLKNSNLPKVYIVLFLILFAIMSPLGNLVSDKILIIKDYETQINAIVIGVFLHISAAILFESSENHQFNLKKFIAILIGFGVAFISL